MRLNRALHAALVQYAMEWEGTRRNVKLGHFLCSEVTSGREGKIYRLVAHVVGNRHGAVPERRLEFAFTGRGKVVSLSYGPPACGPVED